MKTTTFSALGILILLLLTGYTSTESASTSDGPFSEGHAHPGHPISHNFTFDELGQLVAYDPNDLPKRVSGFDPQGHLPTFTLDNPCNNGLPMRLLSGLRNPVFVTCYFLGH
jgi:hypothetical protein